MFINKITLENFRTFYGTHEIFFSEDQLKPVTIIIGENGAGKTNLLNSVFWAFTGRFTKNFKLEDPVLNKAAYAEGTKSCSVEVKFSDAEYTYLLRRIYLNQTDSNISISRYSKRGDALEPLNSDSARTLIEKMIPANIASWFFFDGEAIEQLHLDGRSKFRSDIRQTFGFSSLESLIEILRDIEKDYETEERKLIKNKDLDQIASELEMWEQELTKSLKLQEIHKENISINEKKTIEIGLRLSKFTQAEPIQARQMIAERKLKEAKKEKDQKQRNRNNFFIEQVPKVLLNNHLERLISNLNQKEEDQTLPEPFGTKLIEQIKHLGVCICGTVIVPGSQQDKCLDKQGEKGSTADLLKKIFAFRSEIGVYKKEADKFSDLLQQYTQEIGRCESLISEQEQIIRKCDDDIKGINDKEVQSLKEELSNAETNLRENERSLGYQKGQIEIAKKKIQEQKAKQDVILAQQLKTSHLRDEREKTSRILRFVTEQFHRQENEVLNALNKEISGVLQTYLTKNYTVQVDPETYAIQPFDVDGKKTTLSTGQTNVLKFAVVAAIVGMAAKRTTLTQVEWISEPIIAPLMFDAPYSYLDKEYRAGVTKNLSELAGQLIIMFDGDKWNERLSSILTSKIGKAYTLIENAKGEAKPISKDHEINGVLYRFNDYGARDETIVKEIKL